MARTLTESQLASWRRTRAKGRRRIVVEQWLVWSAIAVVGPSLRAFVRNDGGWDAVRAIWSGESAILRLAFAFVLGGVMAYFFGVFSWNRMERLYASATANDPAVKSEPPEPKR